jgi:hypothetical protein
MRLPIVPATLCSRPMMSRAVVLVIVAFCAYSSLRTPHGGSLGVMTSVVAPFATFFLFCWNVKDVLLLARGSSWQELI